MPSEVGPTKGGLEGVAVLDAELSPDDHTRCGFFGLLDCKGTVGEGEGLRLLLEDVGEDTLLELVVFGDRVSV